MSYRTIKLSGWNIKLADDFPAGFESIVSSSVQLPDGQRSSFEKLASSKFATVLKFNILFRAKVYNLILKRHLNRSPLDILKALICTRGQKAFKAGQMLRQRGFLTPSVVACCQKSFAGFTTADFLITDQITDSTPLPQLLGEVSGSEKQAIIEQFGQTVGLMHNQGIFHGDLRLGNVLVKKHDGRYNFVFIDNERTKRFAKLPFRLRVKNLVQVFMLRESLTDADKTIFLTSYIAQQQIPIDRDKLAEKVFSKTAKRLAAKGVKTV
jgi:serine/threonine protein kinase